MFATIVSFVADAYAIIRGHTRRGVVLLTVFALLTVGMSLELRRSARLQAENAALTDVQQRARELIDLWSPYSGDFNGGSRSRGENEGIVAAAADLLEDHVECRPQAYQIARRRLDDARTRATELASATFASYNSFDVWSDAAEAAYEQIRAISRVSPTCR
jgi:hypothetical protein